MTQPDMRISSQMREYNIISSARAPVVQLASHDLFPTRIWQARLKRAVPNLSGIVQAVVEMRAVQPAPAGRTNRGGWNSVDKEVLERPRFAAINELVRSAVSKAMGAMGLANAPHRIESWINLHERGGFNFLHVHEGAYLSGCFYVRVPAGSGNLIFRDPRPGVVHGVLKGAVTNGYRDISLQPEDGLLVLFPCWLEHFVEPHDSDEERIVVAFNALPHHASG